MSNAVVITMMMLSGMSTDNPGDSRVHASRSIGFIDNELHGTGVPATADLVERLEQKEAQTSTEHASSADQLAQDDGQEIVVQGRRRSPIDPLASVNAKSFAVAQEMDKAFIGPIARAYKSGLPGPVRSGFANFVSNLHEPIVFLNDLLQLRPRRALKTLGRFAINSTVGLAGTIDMAKRKPFRMKGHWNSFADTMGVYGIKTGPFFFLPLLGPTTARDFAGNFVDRLVLPFSIGKPFNQTSYSATTNVGHALDYRAEREEEVQAIRASADPYVTSREQYLSRRRKEIAMLRSKHLNPEDAETQLTEASAAGMPNLASH